MGTESTTNLGGKIREHRKGLDLKVYELANKVGIHPAYLTQIEKNVRVPSPDVLRKIEDALSTQLKDTYIHLKFPVDFLPKTKQATARRSYDMVIKTKDGVTIGIDIKIKGNPSLPHGKVTAEIEQALLKAFPNAVKIDTMKKSFFQPASEANLMARRNLSDQPTDKS
jgi:transcriptional regulator with XRE-family HTH domain